MSIGQQSLPLPRLHRIGVASGLLGTAWLTGQTIGAVMLAAIYGVWNLPDGQGETIAMCGGVVCAALPPRAL